MAKKKKSLLPKKIAGVKVPKAVRKGRFGELLASPTGQAVIAEALMAAGAAGGGKKVKAGAKAKRARADVGDKLRGAGDSAGTGATGASSALAYALGEAARSFTEALQRRSEASGDARPGAEGWTERAAHDDGGDSKQRQSASYEAGPL